MKKETEAKIRDLLDNMTLREKLGQMTQLNANFFTGTDAEITGPAQKMGISREDLKNIGSVLNFKSAAEVIEIQDRHLAEDRNKIPMIFMMDVIHGYRTIFPVPLGMGASFDPDCAAECSRVAAREASAGGVQLTFTPMVDYVRDARWGRVMETCGEEPLLNGRMGAAQVKAFHGDGLSSKDSLAACVKHFAGYGGAEAGRDYNGVEISERLLRETYLPAYKDCIDAGADMVMPSFNNLNGIPSTANTLIMNKILRDEWGFDGIVISDYAAIKELKKHGVAGSDSEAAAKAMKCRCDIEMMTSTYISTGEKLVADGIVSVEQIDESVEKILSLKAELGLFDNPYHGASTKPDSELFLSEESRDVVRRAAEGCAVLLKNNGVLPFSEDIKKLAVIGPFADTGEILGGWCCNGRTDEAVTVAQGLKNLLPGAEINVVDGCSAVWNDSEVPGLDAAVAAAKDADAVILCIGEPQDYTGESKSRTELSLSAAQTALVKAVAGINPNTAACIFGGRPIVLSSVEPLLPAILECWMPGTEGGNAVADLLFGRANPSGKVPMSFPKATGQCPIYYSRPHVGRPVGPDAEYKFKPYASNYIDCGNLPLYPFGFGLSYSEFVYESMTLDSHELSADGSLKVSIAVRNNGTRDGREVVQLYFRDVVASAVRPVQKLLDFKKVLIKAGETVSVEFTVTEPQLRFVDFDCKTVSEPGEFEIFTGYADHRVLEDKFILK